MELIVVHNPTAGGGEWSADDIDRLLRQAGHTPRIVSSKKKWKHVLNAPADGFVAAGGDGTVHRLIHELSERDVPIAILPIGTANNVAHAFGYNAGDDLLRRAASWGEGEETLCLALVERDGKRTPVVEVVGVGAFANMVRRADSGKKKSPPVEAIPAIRERLAYELLTAEPMQIVSSIDGTPVVGEYVLLECLNLPFFGPRLSLAPGESTGGEAVTLCGVQADQRDQAAHWVRTGERTPSNFVLGQGTSIEIGTEAPAHVDGDPWPDRKARGHLRIQACARSARLWV